MLTQEVLLQLQKYNFDLLARQEPSGRRRLRYMALAHIKDGKTTSETALALRVTPRAVAQWLKWFVDEGLDRLAGIPHYWSPQRFPKVQEKAFLGYVRRQTRSRIRKYGASQADIGLVNAALQCRGSSVSR
jgi:hypothetical protein